MIRAGERGISPRNLIKALLRLVGTKSAICQKCRLRDEIREKYLAAGWEFKKGKGAVNGDIAMIYKFHEI